MTLQQIRDAIDADLATLWPQVVSRQATYFTNHGRYWQGIVTHSVIPADGTATAADQLNLAPYYQADAWPTGAGISAFTKPYALEIWEYNGPSGPGFVGFCWVRVAGNLYLRVKDCGVEDYRTQGWAQVA